MPGKIKGLKFFKEFSALSHHPSRGKWICLVEHTVWKWAFPTGSHMMGQTKWQHQKGAIFQKLIPEFWAVNNPYWGQNVHSSLCRFCFLRVNMQKLRCRANSSWWGIFTFHRWHLMSAKVHNDVPPKGPGSLSHFQSTSVHQLIKKKRIERRER